jgi:hypothetical protein
VLDDKKEGKKQIVVPTKEQKGCAHTNMVGEGPNGRCSKDLTPKFKPRLLGKKDQRENRKGSTMGTWNVGKGPTPIPKGR